MIARVLAWLLAAAVAVLGIHVVIVVVAVAVAAVVVALAWVIAERVAETGWSTRPHGGAHHAW